MGVLSLVFFGVVGILGTLAVDETCVTHVKGTVSAACVGEVDGWISNMEAWDFLTQGWADSICERECMQEVVNGVLGCASQDEKFLFVQTACSSPCRSPLSLAVSAMMELPSISSEDLSIEEGVPAFCADRSFYNVLRSLTSLPRTCFDAVVRFVPVDEQNAFLCGLRKWFFYAVSLCDPRVDTCHTKMKDVPGTVDMSACPSAFTSSTTCSVECKNALQGYVDALGCCFDTNQRVWATLAYELQNPTCSGTEVDPTESMVEMQNALAACTITMPSSCAKAPPFLLNSNWTWTDEIVRYSATYERNFTEVATALPTYRTAFRNRLTRYVAPPMVFSAGVVPGSVVIESDIVQALWDTFDTHSVSPIVLVSLSDEITRELSNDEILNPTTVPMNTSTPFRPLPSLLGARSSAIGALDVPDVWVQQLPDLLGSAVESVPETPVPTTSALLSSGSPRVGFNVFFAIACCLSVAYSCGRVLGRDV